MTLLWWSVVYNSCQGKELSMFVSLLVSTFNNQNYAKLTKHSHDRENIPAVEKSCPGSFQSTFLWKKKIWKHNPFMEIVAYVKEGNVLNTLVAKYLSFAIRFSILQTPT